MRKSLLVGLLLLPACVAGAAGISTVDNQFLDLIERRAFGFFWNETNPTNGLIRDQAGNFAADTNEFRLYRASIASVGFGLSAYCVGVERGWITREAAAERVRNTLKTFETQLDRDANGLYYHWIDIRTGQRWMWEAGGGSEISSIDTVLFLAGAITAGEYFDEKFGVPEFKQAADRIYRSIRWNAFGEHLTAYYNEYILITLLGMGCPEHTIPPAAWDGILRNYQSSTVNRKEEGGYPRIFYPSLFVHLFPQAWFDFRNRHDRYANYFLCSKYSVLSNRRYCMDHAVGGIADPKFQFDTYGSNVWGLSACEAPPPKGYEHYGEAEPALADVPESGMRGVDGTVAIHAAGGSVPFAPEESLAMLRHLYRKYGASLWGRYGFCDSFNMDRRIRDRFNDAAGTMWRADIVSGIDQGITLLMIENFRSGLIWNAFMRNEHVKDAMTRAGFVEQPAESGGAGVDLAGTWRFQAGDDPAWKEPDVDDSAWRPIDVPAAWENAGLPKYDGIAWYRRSVVVPSNSYFTTGPLVLRFGAIDDADETFFNGRKIGGLGEFPPGGASAWDTMRLYAVPVDAIRFDATNWIAVRVNDNVKNGGIWKGPVDLLRADSVEYRPFYIPIPDVK